MTGRRTFFTALVTAGAGFLAGCTTTYSSTSPEGRSELWLCSDDEALAAIQEAIGRVFPRADPRPIQGYQKGFTWWHMPLLDRTDFRLTLSTQRGATANGSVTGLAISVATYGTQGLVDARYVKPLMDEIRKVSAERGITVASVSGAVHVAGAKQAAGQASTTSPQSSGTGFFVSSSGHLVTSDHVVANSSRVELVLASGTRTPAQVLHRDPSNDIALLKTETRATALVLASSDAAAKGAEVFTLGYPLVGIQGQEQKATFGRINALSGVRGDVRYFQVDVPIQPGNSGGPLLTEDGRVVGVVAASLNQLKALRETGALPQNVNYAVKADYVLPLLRIANIASEALPKAPAGTRRELARLEQSVVQVVSY